MGTSVVIPGTSRPSNLHLADGVQIETLDSDVLGVCDQVSEISDRLFLVVLRQEDKYAVAIMEHCDDGVDRLVFKVRNLDGRVLKRIRRMIGMPLKERIAKAEKDEHRMQEEAKEEKFEELWDRLGGPMYRQLHHDGFSQAPVSYPKVGVAAPGRRR